ncbi:hypothetical protein IPF86_02995 [Candidatus Nomurabacteria bacterium]|nr:MAG: hypothetical protein IPF86_02995 [Candidatus Nomurabacteria bacterium]
MKKAIQPQGFGEGLTVPMPKIWVSDDDMIDQKVGIHMCEFHEDCDPAPGWKRKDVSMTGNCNCHLKGTTVTITGLKATSRATFYRSTCYTIAEDKNLIHESEFSSEKEDSAGVSGYVLENEKGQLLTAAYTYTSAIKQPLFGYVFNTGLLKIMLKNGLAVGNPIKAWPVKCKNNEGSKRSLNGSSLTWQELANVILVKKK